MKNVSHFLAVLFLFSAFAVACETDDGHTDRGERATPIAGYELSPIDLSRSVQVSSTVEPENRVTIASRMSGLVTSLNVREGDRISRGDLLLELDVEELEAELERTRAELELAQAQYNRNAQLLEQQAISTSEYEESRANYKIAQSDVKLRETRLGFGSVRAPEDLVILERLVEEGDAVSNNEPLFVVADLNRLVVRVGVSERDVVHINEGDTADLLIDAFPVLTFSGTVQRVFPSADSDSRLITVEVSMRAEQKDVVIRPGFLARVRLDADRQQGVLAVPSESLLASTRDQKFVYIINSDDRLEQREVITGIERRNWTQILDGLEEGDVIVGGNPGNLRENLQVTVSRWVDEGSPETFTER